MSVKKSIRKSIILSIMLLGAVMAHAEAWDGTSISSGLQGSGTADDPYQIWTGADLYYLQQHSDLWTYGHYFVQKDDIDMGDHVLEPIGYGWGTNENCNSLKPFGATYDGRGCTISNAHINWGDCNDANKRAVGFFGFVTGTIKNLRFDAARVTRDAGACTRVGDEIKIGIVAGAVTPDRDNTKTVNLDNIIITNSVIDDGMDAGEADPQHRSYFIGGVVGDISSGFGTYSTIGSTSRGSVSIHNIYADFDVNMPGTTRSGVGSSQSMQYNIGGVVGRMRRGKYMDLPTSTFYTGTVKAPLATISPLIGHSRATGNSDKTAMTQGFAWEVITPDAQNTQSPTTMVISSDVIEVNNVTVYPARERLFGNYSIYDSAVGDVVSITGDYPLAASTRYGMRTLDERTQSEITFTYNDPLSMRAWQGVSHGTYVDVNTGAGRLTVQNMLNTNNTDSIVRFAWDETGSVMQFVVDASLTLSRPKLHTFMLSVENYRSSNTYKYEWTVTKTDGTADTFDCLSTDGSRTVRGYTVAPERGGCYITLPDEMTAYKALSVVLYDGNGNALCDLSRTIDAIEADIERGVGADASGSLDHYVLRPFVKVGDKSYTVDDEMMDGVTATWEILENGTYIPLSTSSYAATHADPDSRCAYVKQGYVGTVRTRIYDTEIAGSQYLLYSNGNEYYEVNIQPLHVAITMMEYNPSKLDSITFKAADYFTGSKGYDIQDSTKKGYHTSDTDQGHGSIVWSDGTVKYLTADNLLGTLDDTNVLPLVFKATIVDQFGNNWLTADNKSQWRIQWSYRIPGDGTMLAAGTTVPIGATVRPGATFPEGSYWASTGTPLTDAERVITVKTVLPDSIKLGGNMPDPERCSENYDYAANDGYNLVNGSFDPTASATDWGLPDAVTGSHIDWLGDYWRLHGTSDTNFSTDRYGEYRVDNDGLCLVIHPNLLHCTSAFWVRARLYNVAGDPLGENPGETVIEFNQLAVDFDRTRDADGAVTDYTAKIVWRGDKSVYGSSSNCTYTWYASEDPTDENSWVKVASHTNVAGVRERTDHLLPLDAGFEFSPTAYYKVDFLTSSGTHLTDIVGPVNVVYVYDRAQTIENTAKHNFDPYCYQTNEYYPDGSDTNTGHDPQNAVKTMERAYELLDTYADGGTTQTNCIVVMGYYYNANYLARDRRTLGEYARHTTLTGAQGSYIKGGAWGWGVEGGGETALSLQAPLRLSDLDIYCNSKTRNYNVLYCFNHDFTVDEGVRMVHFVNMAGTSSGLDNNVYAPNFTLVIGRINDNTDMTLPGNEISYAENVDENCTTVVLRSAGYGRIIVGARNTGFQWTAKNTFASPTNPARVNMTIDIRCDNGDMTQYAPHWEGKDGDNNTVMPCNTNIGVIVGGQTDGSIYADMVVSLHNGTIARYAAGNITYSRQLGPHDSFFGSTVLNIYGGTIEQLFGGCIGRWASASPSTDQLEGYMYGRSVINLWGGTVGNRSKGGYNLYAAGAGCVTGIGHDWSYERSGEGARTYTPDQYVPYYDASGSLQYGDYLTATAAGNSFPRIQLYDPVKQEFGEYLHLDSTYVEVNLYGGTVNGDIYGGGYGYSTSLDYDRVPGRVLDNGDFMALAGVLYGDAYVRLLSDPNGGTPVTVNGHIYGGGAGDLTYITKCNGAKYNTNYAYDFSCIAQVFGNTTVVIEDGTVTGNVFGGGRGVEGYPEMGNTYGNATVTMTGGEVQGNIYGGPQFSDICSYTEDGQTYGGNATVTITDGTIGNCVFGGGLGTADYTDLEGNLVAGTASNITGDATVNIFGGQFSNEANDAGGDLKNFNIYGGGYRNCTVGGNTYVTLTSAPLVFEESLGEESFSTLFNDITVRRFCVYGGGWGQQTLVKGDANVHINISEETLGRTVTAPTIDGISNIVYYQTLFDVAGGGYNGDIGYWADASGTPVTSATPLGEYNYVGGNVHIEIEGAPFIRKVIGGGFYGQCNNTEMYVREGTINEIYGGALMGYVHNNARMHIGSRSVEKTDSAAVAARNARLFVTGNIYGGNDVKGIVGTVFWVDEFAGMPGEGYESTDGGPLYCADVADRDDKGVTMSLNGGIVKGNVYGAGNGHYRGYYVPGWARYGEGPDRQYRKVLLPGKTPGSTAESDYGKVYRSRPMVGKVTMHISGNSADDRVTVMGDVFGGGRSCTIGQWNTVLPYEDPRRLSKGGFLHVNFGSHVTVGGSVYMGSEGDGFDEGNVVPEGIDLSSFDGTKTADLDRMGAVAYDHWYYDRDRLCYLPGYPAPGKTDGNFGMYGEHQLRGYVKNIEMNGDVELTFYNMPFVTDAEGNPVWEDGHVLRKRWVPGEQAVSLYDATDIQFTNFYGGGSCGSMTNNSVMWWDYTLNGPIDDPTAPAYTGHELEQEGAIYRYALPQGVTILDRVVGGSEMATNRVYPFTSSLCTAFDKTGEPWYTFEGGMVTHASYDYYLIVYNDINGTDTSTLTDDMYESVKSHTGAYTLKDGTVIYPMLYSATNPAFPNAAHLSNRRYALAYTADGGAYCGARESRGEYTVLKLTVRSNFDPQPGEQDADPTWDSDVIDAEHFIHYGGVVYGGCFESGVTQGDVVVTVSSNLIGEHLSAEHSDTFGQISRLEHNIGRVFGGGYGADSRVDGNTYVNLLRNFVGMNVFGGGCEGDVNGTANVKYMGREDVSYVFGAIYGGGLRGRVGIPLGQEGATPVATNVRLYSGNVDEVYGGACLGDLYGRTNVELCDQVYTDEDFDHFNYTKMLYDGAGIEDWAGARLIAGTVFGGNDISGNIYPQPAAYTGTSETLKARAALTTYICARGAGRPGRLLRLRGLPQAAPRG